MNILEDATLMWFLMGIIFSVCVIAFLIIYSVRIQKFRIRKLELALVAISLYIPIFFNCLPIAFFWFNLIEFKGENMILKGMLSTQIGSFSRSSGEFKADEYYWDRNDKNRTRVIIYSNANCFYSHVTKNYNRVKSFLVAARLQENTKLRCLDGRSLENRFVVIRISSGFLFGILLIWIYRIRIRNSVSMQSIK